MAEYTVGGWDRWENMQQERVGQVGEYTVGEYTAGEGGIWVSLFLSHGGGRCIVQAMHCMSAHTIERVKCVSVLCLNIGSW